MHRLPSMKNVNTDNTPSKDVTSELDFVSTVEKGRKIKGKIQERLQNMLSDEKHEDQVAFDKSLLQPPISNSALYTLASPRNKRDHNNKRITGLSDEDAHVSKHKQIGIFPVSDTLLYPPRRSHTGWQIGLRSYPDDPPAAKTAALFHVESKNVLEMSSHIDISSLRVRVLPGMQSNTSSRPSSGVSRKKRHGSIAEQKFAEYGVLQLAELSEDTASRYFGEEAVSRYHETYRQLHHQADLLKDWREGLERVVRDATEPGLFGEAAAQLEASGVLTPRDELERRYGKSHSRSRTSSPPHLIKASKVSPSSHAHLQQGQHHSNRSHLMQDTNEQPPISTEEEDQHRERLLKLNDRSLDLLDTAADMSYHPASPRAIFLAGCLREGLPPRAAAMLRKRISPVLNLAHLGLGDTTAMLLAAALDQIPLLQVLNLNDNALSDKGLAALVTAASKHATLEVLDVSQNVIDDDSASALADFIGRPDCTLKCLHMSNANIDDAECAHFIDVVMRNRHLKELDMSNNLLGSGENLNVVKPNFTTGGEALAELIANSKCPIEILNVSCRDIDKCVLITLFTNVSLFSVQLHWNMLRLQGAEMLCDALRDNHFLTDLDLSYNALGASAACVLGAALMENKTLTKINVANNGIDAVGTLTLCVGLRENLSLKKVILDGNSVGEQGARILMKVATHAGHRLEISSDKCDISGQQHARYRLDAPGGDYFLHLNKPYDRAIALEILDTIANDSNLEISDFQFLDIPPASFPESGTAQQQLAAFFAAGPVDYAVFRFEELLEAELRPPEESEEELMNEGIAPLENVPLARLRRLVREHDDHGIDAFPTNRLMPLLTDIIQVSHERRNIQPHDIDLRRVESVKKQLISDARHTLDPRDSGVIDSDDFVEWLTYRTKTAKDRLRLLRYIPRCAVVRTSLLPSNIKKRPASGRPASGKKATSQHNSDNHDTMIGLASVDMNHFKRCIPPAYGILRIKVRESYAALEEDDPRNVPLYPLSAAKCSELLVAIKKTSQPVPLLLLAIDSCWFRLEEAQAVFALCKHKADDPTLALAKILLRMVTPTEAKRLLQCSVGDDLVRSRRLKQRMGSAYGPLIGLYSGWYSLDLTSAMDRTALKRLIEQSVRCTEKRRRQNLCDTSQHGHWSCFRNEWNKGIPLPPDTTKEEVCIIPKFFSPIPTRGRVEFDFVNIERPDLYLCRAVHEDRILDALLLSRLLEEEDIDWAVARLQELAQASRRTLLPDGHSYYRPDLARAQIMADCLYSMYNPNSLAGRSAARNKAMKREAIKSAAPVNESKGKQKGGSAKGAKTSLYSSAASVRKNRAAGMGSASAATQPGLTTAAFAAVEAVEASFSDTTSSAIVSAEATAISPAETRPGSAATTTPGTTRPGSSTHKARPTLARGGGMALASPFKAVTRIKEAITKFRNLARRGSHAEMKVRVWGKRLLEVVIESTGSDEYKSAALLEFFETELANGWLHCRYLALILELFSPLGIAQRSSHGSYRVELIILFFDRIVDLHNFDMILQALNAEEHAALICRLGLLNIFNPCRPEGGWSFDLTRWEERQATKILIHLSIVEPGENWLNKQFIFDRGFQPMSSFTLSSEWLKEDGLGKKGLLSFEMFAGDGLRLLGCAVDPQLRVMLCALTLCPARDVLNEIDHHDMQLREDRTHIRTHHVHLHHHTQTHQKRHVNDVITSSSGGTAVIAPHNDPRAVLIANAATNSRPTSANKPAVSTPRADVESNLLLAHPLHLHATLALPKLESQREILGQLIALKANGSPMQFTMDDCNQHLQRETDITWNYTSCLKKPELWTG